MERRVIDLVSMLPVYCTRVTYSFLTNSRTSPILFESAAFSEALSAQSRALPTRPRPFSTTLAPALAIATAVTGSTRFWNSSLASIRFYSIIL